MRRPFVVAAVAAVSLAVPATVGAHLLDHPFPMTMSEPAPLSTEVNSGGDGAKWDLLASLPTANPQSDLDFFTQTNAQGVKEFYASIGLLGSGANGGGQSIVKLTEGGKVTNSPNFVSSHPSAACATLATGITGLQHDVEATPKSDTLLNTDFPGAVRADAQLLLDATDAPGRCHDQGTLGAPGAAQGGLEIIDVTDVNAPKEIGFTSHIGQSHTVNVDPRRPHIAYSVTSDGVSVNADGTRANDTNSTNAAGQTVLSRGLDGFEVVDLRSCLVAPLGTIPASVNSLTAKDRIAAKRQMCRPEVYRYRYPNVDISLGHANRSQSTVFGCHELEIYPDDRMACGSGSAGIVFDIKKMFNDNGTPDLFTDDKLNGKALPCRVRPSSNNPQSPSAAFTSGAQVTDCVIGSESGTTEGPTVDLGVPNWLKIGAPSVTGIEHVGSVFHQGRESTEGAARPAFPSTEDIDFNHEMEFTDSRRFVLATDERGGGIAAGAQCTPGTDLDFANGGVHAYSVDRLQKGTPQSRFAPERAAEAHKAYARDSKGKKSIFRARVRTQPEGSFCTAHVMQQIPGQNRIFMGWYSQGTQVIDFTENADGTLDFKEAGYFIPEGANQWVSSVFKMEKNADGSFTYFGATGDGIVGPSRGRNGTDIYKVTLPAPPKPASRVTSPPTTNPNPTTTASQKPGVTPGTPPKTTTPPTACAATSGFTTVGATRRGRGANLAFTRRTQNPVTVDVFRQSVGRRVIGERLVARFSNRSSSVRWNGKANRGRKGALGDGYYFVRYRMKTSQGTDTRRVVLKRSRGRFTRQTDFFRRGSCDLLLRYKLERPVFGGTGRAAPLGISYQLARDSRVTVTVLRGTKVVKRFPARSVTAKRLVRLRLSGKGLPRGQYRVRLSAREASGATVSSTLASQKL